MIRPVPRLPTVRSRYLDASLAGAGIGLAGVLLLAVAVSAELTLELDRSLMVAIRDAGLRDILSPLRLVTELGSTGAVTLVAVLTLAVGILIGPWRHGVIGAATIGLASLGVETVKAVVARTRPEVVEPIIQERGFSFPSGHATLSMTAWGIFGVLVMRSRLPLGVRRAIAIAFGIVVLLVGVSRVWLGVHFPTDVLAGWTAGAVIVLLYARFTRQVSPEPAAAAVDVDPAAPRSDPPAAG